MTGQVRRCNAHGMFIETPHDAAVGYMMDLTIEMPWGPIACTAVPRFVGDTADGRGIGIEFHVMDHGDRVRWNAYYRGLVEQTPPTSASASPDADGEWWL